MLLFLWISPPPTSSQVYYATLSLGLWILVHHPSTIFILCPSVYYCLIWVLLVVFTPIQQHRLHCFCLLIPLILPFSFVSSIPAFVSALFVSVWITFEFIFLKFCLSLPLWFPCLRIHWLHAPTPIISPLFSVYIVSCPIWWSES